jgi:hypothetical protein
MREREIVWVGVWVGGCDARLVYFVCFHAKGMFILFECEYMCVCCDTIFELYEIKRIEKYSYEDFRLAEFLSQYQKIINAHSLTLLAYTDNTHTHTHTHTQILNIQPNGGGGGMVVVRIYMLVNSSKF